MIGSAELGDVLLDNQGELYFRTTFVGSGSLQAYSVKNVSRLPVHFEWLVSQLDRSILQVDTPSGVIEPNETQVSFSLLLILHASVVVTLRDVSDSCVAIHPEEGRQVRVEAIFVGVEHLAWCRLSRRQEA